MTIHEEAEVILRIPLTTEEQENWGNPLWWDWSAILNKCLPEGYTHTVETQRVKGDSDG